MGASYRAHQTHHAFANCGPTQRPDREILFADTVQHSRQLYTDDLPRAVFGSDDIYRLAGLRVGPGGFSLPGIGLATDSPPVTITGSFDVNV